MDSITRTALIVKQNNVSLGVEYYDALNYKLLRINVTNSLQLKELIDNKKLNYMLRNIKEVGLQALHR